MCHEGLDRKDGRILAPYDLIRIHSRNKSHPNNFVFSIFFFLKVFVLCRLYMIPPLRPASVSPRKRDRR